MLEEKIKEDYVQAMKGRDKTKSGTLSFLKAQLKNVIIEKKVEKLEDQEVISIIKKQVKQRLDSITQYEKGGRQELADQEASELAILKEYLPEEMPEDQLESIVVQAIDESQAASMKDMGKVMKIATEKVGGRADNKLVSELVKRALSQM